MNRLVALLVAAVLVVGAILVNRAIHDDDTSGGGTPSPSERVRIVCATELSDACKQIGQELPEGVTVRIESPGATSAALAAGEKADFDLWVVPRPWPALTRERAAAAGTTAELAGDTGEAAVLAARRLGLSLQRSWVAPLTEGCGGTITWKCVLDNDGRAWSDISAGPAGTFKLGVADPDETDGVLAIGAMTSGWFNDPAIDLPDYDVIDINDTFSSVLSRAAVNAGSDRDPLTRQLTQRGSYGAVAASGVQQRLAAVDASDAFTPVALEPVVSAQVVAVAPTSAGRRTALDVVGLRRLREAITTSGWDAAAASDTTALPDAATLDLLVSKWTTR